MKIMVIDGNSILNRAFYGIRQLTNHEGLPTNAVYGFLATLFKLQDEEQPDRTIVCFDVKEKTFRHLKFDTYKATRKGMPDELAAQLPITKQVLDALGVTRCEKAGYEADDLLGTQKLMVCLIRPRRCRYKHHLVNHAFKFFKIKGSVILSRRQSEPIIN